MQRKLLLKFIGKVVFYLPFMFAVWYYYCSGLIVGLIAWLLEGILVNLFPAVLSELKPLGYTLEVVTRLPIPEQPGYSVPAGAVIAFDVNPLLYGYGLPFFFALLAALPENEGQTGQIHSWHVLVGTIVLLLVQMIGIHFDLWKALIFQFGHVLDQHLQVAHYTPGLVAYGYQLSSLVLPVVTPVILWLSFYQDYWRTLGQTCTTRPDSPHS